MLKLLKMEAETIMSLIDNFPGRAWDVEEAEWFTDKVVQKVRKIKRGNKIAKTNETAQEEKKTHQILEHVFDILFILTFEWYVAIVFLY